MTEYQENLLGALAVGCYDFQDRAMAKTGQDLAERMVLLFVFTRPGSTIRDIQASAALTHSGVVRVVDRLAAAKLVSRKTGTDRRTATLVCTPAGRTAAQAVLAARARALDELFGALSEREQQEFELLAQKLLARLPENRAMGRSICRYCDHDVCQKAGCPVADAVTDGEYDAD